MLHQGKPQSTFENVCLRALDDEDVLLPTVGQVHVYVEGILDHVSHLHTHTPDELRFVYFRVNMRVFIYPQGKYLFR